MRIRYILALVFVCLPAVIFILRWLSVLIAALVRGSATNCPVCRSERTRWSKLRLSDLLLPSFVMPRRCDACECRFYTAQSMNYARRAKPGAASESASPHTSGPSVG